MSSNERNLLTVFLVLIALLGGALGVQQFRAWQHRIERKERDVELKQMEASSLLAEAERWTACREWLAQAQPMAQSDLEAEQGLLDSLRSSSSNAGLEIKKTTPETKQTTPFYRQFSVTLVLKGEVEALFRWLHELQQPTTFYVVPNITISPDKEDPTKVNATVQIMRWYTPELAAAQTGEAPAEGAPSVPTQ